MTEEVSGDIKFAIEVAADEGQVPEDAWDRVDAAMKRDADVRAALLAAYEAHLALLDGPDQHSIKPYEAATEMMRAAVALARSRN